METTESSSAGVKPAITAADVAAWVHRKIAESGFANCEMIIGSRDNGAVSFIACVSGDLGITESDHTSPEAAFAKVRAKIKTPDQLAQEKREAAAKLLAEADALSPKLTPALVIQDREGVAA